MGPENKSICKLNQCRKIGDQETHTFKVPNAYSGPKDASIPSSV